MIPAVVLAAGKSMRMGRPKALLPLASNETFLARIVRTLREAQVEDVVVVLGHEPAAVMAALGDSQPAARFVINPEYETGQLSSLLAGLRVIDRPGVVAALVTLVDMPLVTTATVRAIVDRYRRTTVPIVRPVNKGRHGHPVLIDRSLFDSLREADGAVGPRMIIRANASSDGDVEVDDEGAFRDVDTPAEYDRLLTDLRAHQ